MGDPAPSGKVVDFTAARDGATKGKPPEKAVPPDKGKQADKAKDTAKPRRGRPPKADKAVSKEMPLSLGTLRIIAPEVVVGLRLQWPLR